MSRLFLFGSVLCLLSVALVAQEMQIQRPPLNPEFVRYLEDLREGRLKLFTESGHPLGEVPHPVVFSSTVPDNLDRGRDLPEVYDLRTLGLVTPVKDQGTCGSCWTFATMGSLESRWLKLGLGTYDLSENNLNQGHGYLYPPCIGGNPYMSSAYLSRGDGPISEADDPYQGEYGSYHPGLTPQAYVPDGRFLVRDMDVLKQTLYDYGAIHTNMRYEDVYYREYDCTYYCNVHPDSSTNHAVLLVGWDDNKPTAGGTGAWIIKNSWGTSWGEGGYFYISYNDTKVNTCTAMWPNHVPHDHNANIHYYDKLGALDVIGYGNPVGYALARFDFSADETVTRIDTWVATSNSSVAIDAYDQFDGVELGTQLCDLGTQSCLWSGYYSYELPVPLELSAGDAIYVRVRYETPGNGYPVPIETAVEGFADPEIVSGKAWLSYCGEDSTWLPIGDTTQYPYDLGIKLYGIGEGGSGETVELIYDDGAPTDCVYWWYATQGSAVRMTPPNYPATIVNISYYLQTLTPTGMGNGSFVARVCDFNGTPGADLITPLTVTPQGPGWVDVDLASYETEVDGEFIVGLFYDGSNFPCLGFDPVNNGRGWNFDGYTWGQWDATYFIRATVTSGLAVEEQLELTGFCAQTGNGCVKLLWDGPSGFEIAGYNVYRGLRPETATMVKQNDTLIRGSSFRDKTAMPGATSFYWIEAVHAGGVGTLFGPFSVTVPGSDSSLRLLQPNPSPSSGLTTIRFFVPETGEVSITLHDVAGREVAVITHPQLMAPGWQEIQWSPVPAGIPSGRYVCRVSLDASERCSRDTRSLIVIR